MATESLVFHASRPSECSNGLHLVAPSCAKSDFLAEKLAAGGASFYTACFFVILFQTALPLGSVHNSSASKILSAKAWLQGEKHSKVEHLASIFNAAGAFLSQNIAA
ncbi:hypothetical protein [Uruburuella suis]|jgi:hypothetical protein|nr:hypothetical protein [Uruburuella suis]